MTRSPHSSLGTFTSILQISNRLLKLPDNHLTKRIYIDDFYLAQSGHDNWCSHVFKILEKLNLEYLFYERKMVDINEIKDQLMNRQNDMWKQAVPKKTKLRIFCLFKETTDIENYNSLLNPCLCSVCRYRICVTITMQPYIYTCFRVTL